MRGQQSQVAPADIPTAASNLPLGIAPGSWASTDPIFVAKARALDSERLDQVCACLRSHAGWKENLVSQGRKEFLRFCALLTVTDEVLSPGPLVDGFWHEFLLHTRDYANFCERHFGCFLHHDPVDKTAGSAQEWATTRRVYCKYYAEYPFAMLDSPPSIVGHVVDRWNNLRKRLASAALLGEAPRLPELVTDDHEFSLFKKWGNWNNSWKNWGDWNQWTKWQKERDCYSGDR